MKELTYATKGTCSRAIRIVLNYDNTVDSVVFMGGCAGNTSGISKLVKGMSADEVISRLKGTTCGFRPTSCPDQLATALEEMTK